MCAIVFLALRRRRLTRISCATWLLGLLLHIITALSSSWRHLLLEIFALLLLLLLFTLLWVAPSAPLSTPHN